MISAQRLSSTSSAAFAAFGIAFWLYGALALLLPAVFVPMSYILAILTVILVSFLALSSALAGGANRARHWDEGTGHDSIRAYKFGFTVAWIVYPVAWFLLVQGWVTWDAAFVVMAAVTGGSYSLFMGMAGIRGWHEARHASD